MKLSIDKLTVNILWINSCIFYVGFILGPGFYRVNPAYFLTTDLIVYKVIIFFLLTMLFLLRLRDGTILQRASLFYGFILLVGTYAFLVGLAYGNSFRYMLAHIGNFYVFFMGVFFATSINLDSRYLFENAKKYVDLIGVISIISLLWTIVNQEPGAVFSFGLYGLGIPLAYYIVNGNNALSVFYVIMSIFSGKRALFLAAILIFFMPSSRIKKVERSGKGLATVKALLVNALVFLALYTIDGDLGNKAVGNISSRVATHGEENGSNAVMAIDVVSSGRLTDINSVISTLKDQDKLISGMGYGAAYDSYAYSSTFQYASIGQSSSWYKSGSDIQPAHYILQYGVILGGAIYLFHIIFLFYSIVKSKNQKWYRFLTLLYMYYLVASLFTFIPADPVWGMLIGMLLKCGFDRGGLHVIRMRNARHV